MKRSAKEWAALLKKNGVPTPPGPVRDVRFIMRDAGWWVQTDNGWFWLRYATDRLEAGTWVPSIYGPD